MAEFYYLVGSYRPPSQLRRLVHHINQAVPDAHVIVLRDRGVDQPSAASIGRCDVWTTPAPIRWGDHSLLDAHMAAFRRLALPSNHWLTIISEQSFPLRPLVEYQLALEGSGADCWIEQSILLNPNREGLLNRYRTRSVTLPGSSEGRLRSVGLRAGRFLVVRDGGPGLPLRVDIPKRHYPARLSMGADWMALKGTALRSLLHPRHAHLLSHFRRTFMPTEGYAATVLLNDPRIINSSEPTHYVRFDGGHAATLTDDDLTKALAAGAWFARKFSEDDVLERAVINLG